MPNPRPPKSRIVVDTSRRESAPASRRNRPPSTPEPWIAISIIVAAALATFLALFITSRPFDLNMASLAPQQTIPAAPVASPSSKPSPTTSPTPSTKPSPSPSSTPPAENTAPVDDATIQSRIDAAISADPVLSKLDVSTLVENGKVTIVGSVRSADLKSRVEKAVRAIKGVAGINNQLVVHEATPTSN